MQLLVKTWDANGEPIHDGSIIDDETDEGPAFYAHQLLHADGVVCVQIFPVGEPGSVVEALLTRCDPGVDFTDVVTQNDGGDER